MTTRDDIRSEIGNWQTDVEEDGGLSAILLCHYNGNGQDQQIYGISSKSTSDTWGNADKLAQLLDDAATRHARGMPGTQQYEIRGCFGNPPTVKRYLPVQRQGNLMGVGPQGLGTEPPTEVGRLMQSMRWGEQIVQQTFQSNRHMLSTQQSAIDSRDRTIVSLQNQNGELMVALQSCVQKMMQDAHAMRMAELETARKAEFQKQLMQLAPAIINTIASKEIFPLSTEDTSIIQFFAENLSDDELRMLSSGLAGKPGGDRVSALLIDRFGRHKKKLADERAADRRLLRESPLQRVLYTEGEQDAMGRALDLIGGKSDGDRLNGTTPKQLGAAIVQAAKTAETAKVVPQEELKTVEERVTFSKEDAAELVNMANMWESILAKLPEGQAEMAIGFLGGQDPELAVKLKELYRKIKKQ